ncbi:tetratricopeptide repeat protein [Cyanobium sp. NIES-981]|uniref:tetratricopeptide repeat protein n=1 Tax=Cyanobium sp. NIES-981 TaxID=1851505 RepID=UPI0007DE161C
MHYRHAVHFLHKRQFQAAETLLRTLLEGETATSDPLERKKAQEALAVLFAMTQREAEAITLLEAMQAEHPSDTSALYNLGKIHTQLGDLEAAIGAYRKAMAIEPESLLFHNNLGNALKATGQVEEAVACFQALLARKSDHIRGRWNLAMALLLLGRFEDGWTAYEVRWQAFPNWKRLATSRPLWQGEPVDTLLLWGEQGVGDQLMFASLLPELSARGVQQLLLLIDPRLHPLFRRSFPSIQLHPLNATPEQSLYRAHAPLGSLPRQLRPSRSSFQHSRRSVLLPDLQRSRSFRSSMAPADRVLCGIAWHSANTEYGESKSIALQALAKALALPGVQLVSLQYGDVDAQIQQVQQEAGLTVLRPPGLDCTQDLDGLAALIAACDLVVSISNTTVHLAGTLGTETWVLLEHVPDWRWGLRGTASLWYPSVSLFRQQRAGDWSHPLRQVRQRLRSRPPRGAAGGGSPPSTCPGP